MSRKAKRPRSSSIDSEYSASGSTAVAASVAVAALMRLGDSCDSSLNGKSTDSEQNHNYTTSRKHPKQSFTGSSESDEIGSAEENTYLSDDSHDGLSPKVKRKKIRKVRSETPKKRKRAAGSSSTSDLLPPTPRKKLDSLGGLAIKFLRIIARDGSSNLNSAADELNVMKRRMYDVVNILEGTQMLRKEDRHHVVLGVEGACFIRNEVAEGEEYMMRCWELLENRTARSNSSSGKSTEGQSKQAVIRDRTLALSDSMGPLASGSALLKAKTDKAIDQEMQRIFEQNGRTIPLCSKENCEQTESKQNQHGSKATPLDSSSKASKQKDWNEIVFPGQPWRTENIQLGMLMQLEARLDAHIRNVEAELNKLASQHTDAYVTYSSLAPIIGEFGPNPTIAIHASPESHVQMFKGKPMEPPAPDDSATNVQTTKTAKEENQGNDHVESALHEHHRMMTAIPLPKELDVLGFSWTARERAPNKWEIDSSNKGQYNCLLVKSTDGTPIDVFAIQSGQDISNTQDLPNLNSNKLNLPMNTQGDPNIPGILEAGADKVYQTP